MPWQTQVQGQLHTSAAEAEAEPEAAGPEQGQAQEHQNREDPPPEEETEEFDHEELRKEPEQPQSHQEGAHCSLDGQSFHRHILGHPSWYGESFCRKERDEPEGRGREQYRARKSSGNGSTTFH